MGRFFNDRDSGNRGGRSDRPEMHDAICDKCGKDCKVPFRPSGDKPIYCSSCFETMSPRRDSGSRDSRGGSRDFRGGSRDSRGGGGSNNSAEIKQLKEQINSMSTKLDKILKIITPVEEEIKQVDEE